MVGARVRDPGEHRGPVARHIRRRLWPHNLADEQSGINSTSIRKSSSSYVIFCCRQSPWRNTSQPSFVLDSAANFVPLCFNHNVSWVDCGVVLVWIRDRFCV